MKKSILSLCVLASISLYGAQYNKDQAVMLSLSCASCHGTDGRSVSITPTIAGMGKAYLQSTLLDYKYGRKEGTMMGKHAKGFTDAEIEQIAYYFSKVKR
jgi:sulfide dehydrogenase cytochrome subunit